MPDKAWRKIKQVLKRKKKLGIKDWGVEEINEHIKGKSHQWIFHHQLRTFKSILGYWNLTKLTQKDEWGNYVRKIIQEYNKIIMWG